MVRGAIIAFSFATFVSGCGCAELWSVAEELGAGLSSEQVLAETVSSPPDSKTSQVVVMAPGPSPTNDQVAEDLSARFGSFLGELCYRMRHGNAAYVKRHVELPLRARLRIESADGDSSYRDVVFKRADELRMSGICADLTWLGADIDISRADQNWRVIAKGSGIAVELELTEVKSGRLKLVHYRQL